MWLTQGVGVPAAQVSVATSREPMHPRDRLVGRGPVRHQAAWAVSGVRTRPEKSGDHDVIAVGALVAENRPAGLGEPPPTLFLLDRCLGEFVEPDRHP